MSEWIPKGDRRPKDGQECLITLHGNMADVVIQCVYMDESYCVDVSTGGNMTAHIPILEYAITAWMPLPEPYTEGEANG